MKLDFLYPMPLIPIYKTYLWGGGRISEIRDLSEQNIAESWEVVDREEEMSIVAEGPLKGKTLHSLIGEDLLGVGREEQKFPLLVKLIDAKKDLSIQVHPDENSARLFHGEAKNEMWYALNSGEKQSVLVGLKENVGREEFERSIKENSIIQCLRKIEFQEKDAIYIPAGTVHAILSGAFVLEVQQNSDTTYRIYDWGRKDDKGNPRTLHLKEALSSIHWDSRPEKAKLPLSTPYFTFNQFQIEKRKIFPSNYDSFQIFFLLEGKAKVSAGGISYNMEPLRAYLVPAKADCAEIVAERMSTIIKITL